MGAVKAIGLMSGTSLDGVDVALIETDGERIAGFGPTGYRPYTDTEQALLRQALQEGAALTDRTARPGVLAQADAFVTRVHAETVEAFLATEHIDKAGIAVIGFHGQTVLHKPAARLTVQLGDGAASPRGGDPQQPAQHQRGQPDHQHGGRHRDEYRRRADVEVDPAAAGQALLMQHGEAAGGEQDHRALGRRAQCRRRHQRHLC